MTTHQTICKREIVGSTALYILRYVETGAELPYFGQVWGASRRLSAMVESFDLKGKKVLEIGCGLAMPSLVAAKAGAICTAIDVHTDCEEFLIENKKRNNLGGRIKFIRTQWQDFDSSNFEFDLVIASDVLYSQGQSESFEELLSRILTDRNYAIVVDPGREYVEGFYCLLKSRGYDVERSKQTLDDGTYVCLTVRK